MTAESVLQAARERRRALRATLRELRRRARARVQALPSVRRERLRRRVRRIVGVLLLLLLASLVRCDCKDAGAPRPEARMAAPTPPAKARNPVQREKKRPLRVQMAPQPRGKFGADMQAAPGWVDDFRLQVAARSPRLAECFVGLDKPGALRWTAAVNAKSGAVADHQIESVPPSPELQRGQHDCVVRILSNPNYTLRALQEEALPKSIALVIEF